MRDIWLGQLAFVVLCAGILFDLYLNIWYGVQYTWTVAIYEWSLRSPIIPFTIGVIMGHLFWPIDPSSYDPTGNNKLGQIAFAILCFGILSDIFLAIRYGAEATWSAMLNNWGAQHPIVPFVFGIVMGHLFWPIWSRT